MTGLELVAVEARAVVQSPVAFTELHLTFENPGAVAIDAEFDLDLSPDASVTRFALVTPDGAREGEFLGAVRGPRVFENARQCSLRAALLSTRTDGGVHGKASAVPPRSRRNFIVSYVEALPSSETPYTLELGGLPKLERLDVLVSVNSAPDAGLERHEVDVEPTDVRVHSEGTGLRSGSLAVARISVTGSPSDSAGAEMTVNVPGSAVVWPTTFSGVRPGDELLVYASFATPDPAPIIIEGGGLHGSVSPTVVPPEGSLLPRAISRAQVVIGVPTNRRLAELRARERRILADVDTIVLFETERDERVFGVELPASRFDSVHPEGLRSIARANVPPEDASELDPPAGCEIAEGVRIPPLQRTASPTHLR